MSNLKENQLGSTKESGDLRVRRTRNAIRAAFLALIEEKGFESIVVQDIADRAMINRVTFYKHYRDKYDLLEQTMNEMYQDLMTKVRQAPTSPREQVINNLLVLWLEEVTRYASFYRIMLGKEGSANFSSQVRKQLGGLLADALNHLSVKQNTADNLYAIRLQFIIGGFLNVTEWWLDQKQPLPIHQVASQLQLLLFNVVGDLPDKPDTRTKKVSINKIRSEIASDRENLPN